MVRQNATYKVNNVTKELKSNLKMINDKCFNTDLIFIISRMSSSIIPV